LQNLLPGYAIAYLAIVIAIEVLFVFLSAEKSVDLERKEKENAEVKNRLMMSQIRPHFIYNVLSSVSTLIPVDPPKAQQALDEFTEYLRANFSAATQKKLIPFADELKHVENYVALEKLRFEKRLHVEYDIKARAFEVPPLSIQPLVENAIKHGVTQKTQGGIVTLRSYEEANDFVVEVIDDGVGFDMKSLNQRGDSSIGLSNIEFRIDHMCGGTLTIESQEGAGTKATVRIPKR
jgi:sensor histidine kinase YesM